MAARGLVVGEEGNDGKSNNNFIQYPCPVVNRFECPYEKDKVSLANANFDVEDLFELEKMAFAVEIALAIAIKDTSAAQIRNKQKYIIH